MNNYKIILFITLMIFPLFSQVTISGSITNADGKILPGANIVLEGTSLGIVSDQGGEFTFNISQNDYDKSDGKLIITYIGYITKTIKGRYASK